LLLFVRVSEERLKNYTYIGCEEGFELTVIKVMDSTYWACFFRWSIFYDKIIF